MSDTQTLDMPDEVQIPTEEPKAKKTPKVKAKTACQCQQFAIKVDETTAQAIGCDRETSGKFAPGHDAKLKSLLIEAGTKDLPVLRTVDGEDTEISALDAANLYGFYAHVAKGVEAAKVRLQEREANKAKREAAKAEREAKKAQAKADRDAKKAEREAAKAAKDDEQTDDNA